MNMRVVLLALLLATSCQKRVDERGQKKVLIGSVSVTVRGGGVAVREAVPLVQRDGGSSAVRNVSKRWPELAERQVAQWVGRGLARWPSIRVQPGLTGPRVYGLRVEVALRADEDHGKVAMAGAQARASGDPHGLVLGSSAVGQVGDSRDGPVPAERVRQVIDRAIDDLGYQARLVTGSAQMLIRSLSVRDPRRLRIAVEMAALRRMRETVPRLIELLAHDDETVSDRAIGALVAIGDRRAVKPLTRLAKLSDTAKLAKVIDGIGTLGGDEARQYLEFVARGHPDTDIRDLAEEALGRMKK